MTAKRKAAKKVATRKAPSRKAATRRKKKSVIARRRKAGTRTAASRKKVVVRRKAAPKRKPARPVRATGRRSKPVRSVGRPRKAAKAAKSAARRRTARKATATRRPVRAPETAAALAGPLEAAAPKPVVVEPSPPIAPPLAPANGEYRPSDSEPFMNERQKEYFRAKLLTWKGDLLREARLSTASLTISPDEQADEIDRANAIEARNVVLRAQERQAHLIRKIDQALGRIDDGTYGYCEVTGEPIDLRRLEARPIATLSIAAQEAHERREKLTAHGRDYEQA